MQRIPIFVSHGVNLRPHETEIARDELVDAIPTRTAGIIPNGLTVTTKDGTRHRFVVSGQRAWTAALRRTDP